MFQTLYVQQQHMFSIILHIFNISTIILIRAIYIVQIGWKPGWIRQIIANVFSILIQNMIFGGFSDENIINMITCLTAHKISVIITPLECFKGLHILYDKSSCLILSFFKDNLLHIWYIYIQLTYLHYHSFISCYMYEIK